jgi:hypothetical protein
LELYHAKRETPDDANRPNRRSFSQLGGDQNATGIGQATPNCLQRTNTAVAEARANNEAIQSQLDARAEDFSFKSAGNETQHRQNANIINYLTKALTSVENSNQDEARTYIRKGIKALMQRNKHVKIADQSPAGWAVIAEYTINELTESKKDDRRLKKAEATALAKKKQRFGEAYGRGFKGYGRGYGRGRQAYQGNNAWGYGYQDQTVAHTAWPYQMPVNPPHVYQAQHQFVPAGPHYGPAVTAPAQQTAAPAQPHHNKPLGPCFFCGGSHLRNTCAILRQHMANTQSQIESNFKRT